MKSIQGSFHEIIVVDTGSTDKTIEIIKGINDDKIRLFNTCWSNNFSDARNFAKSLATKKWIMYIDADEYFSENKKIF
ncbi:glycosyltransferase [Serratia sp. UGAL515B_01]|uniref:glycosyltransferase n=1 Tax=Serratia sp. UGAL515B_01 TaxID=2986763 RepID=UPI0039872370